MTLLDDDEAAIKALNLDRLPTHIVDKRVTELMDLTGKKAFVTGAGGDGLGHAIANRLAGSGADIALVGRTLEPLRPGDRGALERQHDSRPGGHVGLGSNPSRGPRSA